jgi:cyclase
MKPINQTTCMRVLLGAVFATAAAAQEADTKISVQPLAGSIYVLRGPDSSNIVASVGADGIVMVDDQEAPAADHILAALKTISNKPIRFVINTHTHGDHTGGNDVFGRLAPVIAHRNVRTHMMNGPDKRPPEAWPAVTFSDEMNLYFNGEDIRILKLPAGHTDGDSAVFFTKSKVVHMGDAFIAPAVSFVDTSNGGTILGLIAELEYVLPQIPADAKVVPGHGATSSRADVARGLEMLKEMKAIVEAGIAAGKSREQLVAEKPFEKWKGVLALTVPTQAYVGRFYNELTAK